MSMLHDEQTLREVAKLHASCIDKGFLSSLGPRFLTVLYRAIDRSDAAVLIVETDNTGVIGFVSGGRGMGPIYRQMLRDWPKMLLSLAPVVIRPRKVWGVVEILRRGDGRNINLDTPPWELFSIAVAPASRGSGVAERLYSALCRHLKTQGVSAFCIVVGDALRPAKRFYTRLGAEPVSKFCVHGKIPSTIYVHRFDQNAI